MPHLTTRVAIVGAGPAGLLLGWSLHRAGIDFVIVENRDRDYVLGRIRAGVLEQGSVETLERLGVGAGVQANGMVHNGIYLQYSGERHHIDFTELLGRTVTIYGQQAVVHDLVEAHDGAGTPVFYDANDVAVHDLTGSPSLTFEHDGQPYTVNADFIVGADGFHGVCRQSVPADALQSYEREYPFAWLGILADVAPSTDELIYALHDDGFAMHSMRSHTVSRLYVQVDPADDIANWSDARIWDALHTRLAVPGWTLDEGPITEKSILPMRSFVVSTLQYGSLFLVGDAGHIVPPTGAKGLNSAMSDVSQLSAALVSHYAGTDTLLAAYSSTALSRQWKVQQFSQWMTDLLHKRPETDAAGAFDYRSQLGRLDYVTHSTEAKRSLAEQYTGLRLDV
ncbi:4-hydroxybenzoate 3-monooxygenase [Subtercola endophyticus]|uniref:4-hydroxybenzoate 3-monooxygenase n=1 Tax=Subtercola endophyticus TaxID=2895559 RepID=UPI001E3CE30A|nr:4-hydroxybenzoate 3-monooxygenase [Subtercola endophyticus]UFS58807.1 4-hydroxybenzoate 3-monooxygenase [Subtercola endophyticus]